MSQAYILSIFKALSHLLLKTILFLVTTNIPILPKRQWDHRCWVTCPRSPTCKWQNRYLFLSQLTLLSILTNLISYGLWDAANAEPSREPAWRWVWQEGLCFSVQHLLKSASQVGADANLSACTSYFNLSSSLISSLWPSQVQVQEGTAHRWPGTPEGCRVSGIWMECCLWIIFFTFPLLQGSWPRKGIHRGP